MANPAKAKGSKAERDVVLYLTENGFPYAERRLAGAQEDKGDIAGVNGVCIEVKDHKTMALSTWVEEMLIETKHAKAWTGIVWHKRRGKSSPADWYVTLTGSMWLELLKKAMGLDETRKS
jgi:Holliday junction resolvase